MRNAGQTILLAVLGRPIGHSLSPLMHGAAIDHLGLDAIYTAFEVPDERVTAVLDAAHTLGFQGLNVTIPHKEAALRHAVCATAAARRVGAANTLWWTERGFAADNTDGAGWLRSLREEAADPCGSRAVILGAGGAARGIADALLDAGCESLRICNRNPGRAAALVADLRSHFPGRRIDTEDVSRLRADSIDLLVNTTPAGMHGAHADELPCSPGLLRPGMIVSDIVYRPLVTPLLRAARKAGATVHPGIGMFIEQGALAFERWFGRPAPVAVMRKAVLRALGEEDEPPGAIAGSPVV